MTCLVSPNILTKRQLREEALANPKGVRLDDPSITRPKSFTLDQLQVGETVYCTNHPRRSWFASITRTPAGLLVR